MGRALRNTCAHTYCDCDPDDGNDDPDGDVYALFDDESVKGRIRGRIQVAVDADDTTVTNAALAEPNVQRFVGDADVRKVIVVPGKLVNIVL